MCLISVEVFPQWKSYYPETTLNKKNIIKKDLEKESLKYNNYLFEGIKAKSLENPEEALKQFQKCIKIDDKKSLPYYESALINKNQGNFALAIEQIKVAITLENNNRWYQLAYAEILLSNHNFKKAALEYKKLIEKEPKNEELYYSLADSYVYNNNLLKAIGVYDQLEEKKGVEKMISMQKYKMYMELKNKKNAIKELLKLTKKFPEDLEALEVLSETYLLNNEKEEAFDVFKKLAVIDPENGRIHLTLANFYRDKGENRKSFEELKLAFKSTKIGVDVKVSILASYFQLLEKNKQMREQADTLAKLLIKTHPESTKPYAIYGDMLYAEKKFQQAKEQYLIVLKKDKTKSQLWTQILFIQAEQNDFSGMLETSEEALSYFSTDPLFYYFNGVSNKRLNNVKKAILVLEMGVEFVFDNDMLLLEFYSLLGDSYHDIEEHANSDSLYEKALSINPENVLVLNNYSYYLSLREVSLQKAKEMSLKCNTIEKENSTYQDTYAWILYKLGEYEKAQQWIKKSLLNGGESSAVIVEHYGDILYKLGKKENAILQWKKAKDLEGESELLNKKIEEGKLYE